MGRTQLIINKDTQVYLQLFAIFAQFIVNNVKNTHFYFHLFECICNTGVFATVGLLRNLSIGVLGVPMFREGSEADSCV